MILRETKELIVIENTSVDTNMVSMLRKNELKYCFGDFTNILAVLITELKTCKVYFYNNQLRVVNNNVVYSFKADECIYTTSNKSTYCKVTLVKSNTTLKSVLSSRDALNLDGTLIFA